MNHERSSPAYLFYCKESIMIVNASYNPLIYGSTPVSYGQAEGGNTLPGSTTKAASSADQVTLSNAGKALSASENTLTQPRTAAQERLIMAASSDTASAEQIAHDMAISKSTIFYNISDLIKNGADDGQLTLSTSGRVVDSSFNTFKNTFEREATQLDEKRLSLYNSEKAKGTDPLKILAMMIDFTLNQ
jgi:hypothetical protein